MRFCKDEECECVACCNHCVNLITTSDFKYVCRIYNEEVYPLDICDEFDCFLNYKDKED